MPEGEREGHQLWGGMHGVLGSHNHPPQVQPSHQARERKYKRIRRWTFFSGLASKKRIQYDLCSCFITSQNGIFVLMHLWVVLVTEKKRKFGSEPWFSVTLVQQHGFWVITHIY